MAKSISVKQKTRGRPATGRSPFVGIRLPKSLIDAIENWAKDNQATSRSEAIRQLVEQALSNSGTSASHSNKRTAAKTAKMARSPSGQLRDKSASPKEKSQTKASSS